MLQVYIILLSLLLAACSEQHSVSSKQTSQEQTQLTSAITLFGTVSDNQGLIKSGKVEAHKLNGELVAETRLENSAKYQLALTAGIPLPLELIFITEGKEKMLAVLAQTTNKQLDINPGTTAIAKAAKAQGGYSIRNLARAAEDQIHVPDANKTSTGFRGDPTKQYGGWH